MINNELRAIYVEGASYDAYVDSVRANADRFRHIYQRLAFIESHAGSSIFHSGMRVLVFCEPYCADCVINLPLIARLVGASRSAELRVVSRNKHQAVADYFPGRDGMSRLPTVVLLDSQWHLLGYWSERGKADREWMSNFTQLDPLPEITLDDGMPVGDFAQWLERRFEGQLPVFYEQNWKDVREELRALANSQFPLNPR
jgi:hypothetical protein